MPNKTYKVQLSYFRQTGMFLATAALESAHDAIMEIWEEVDDLRRFGRLPGLRPGSGRDLFILVDVPDHPQRVLHLVRPSFHDEDDVTPLRIPTGELSPLIRVPLAEIPRTSTRDIIKQPESEDEVDTAVLTGDEVTPGNPSIPKSPSE